tara:strand:+ start:246 stop:512 length:267 start_codon:yes stop_codon:yes gene_type:complete
VVHKFKKILPKNEIRTRYTPVYEYRGFKFRNDSRFNSGRYARWSAWGIDPNGNHVEFHHANKRDRVAWDIDRYLDEGRNDLAYEILNF